jgi:hypothetical protein
MEINQLFDKPHPWKPDGKSSSVCMKNRLTKGIDARNDSLHKHPKYTRQPFI